MTTVLSAPTSRQLMKGNCKLQMKRSLLLTLVLLTVVACGEKAEQPQTAPAQSPAAQPAQPAEQSAKKEITVNDANAVTTPSGLKYVDLVQGKGDEAKSGQTVDVNYTVWLTNGTKFDSSYDAGQPISFKLGAGLVVQGWDEGIAGMKVGGKRKLIIPPDLGYGSRGKGPVPPNAIMVFEVELVGVR